MAIRWGQRGRARSLHMPVKRRKIGARRIGGDLDQIVQAFLSGREPPAHIPPDEAFLQLRFWKASPEGRRVLAEREGGRMRPLNRHR
jgi:hypothetical protein